MKINTIIILSLLLKAAVSIQPIPDADDKLHIYALPVGQGDCTVIQCPKAKGDPVKGVVSIIDAGASNSRGIDGQGIVNFLAGTKLNFAVITHSHKDHYSYMETILDYYGNSYYKEHGTMKKFTVYHSCDWSDYLVNSQFASPYKVLPCVGINNCKKSVLKKNIHVCSSDIFVSFSFVASAVGGCAGKPNSDSIISKITYAGQSTLITGDFDLNTNDMKAFLQEAGPDLKSQIYRLSHHGALHANPENFLSSIQAEYVFSSSGYRYGHPRCEIYDYYKNRLTNILPAHPYTCYYVDSGKYERVDQNIKKPIFVTSLFREKSPGQLVESYYVVEFSISSSGDVGVKFTHIGDE